LTTNNIDPFTGMKQMFYIYNKYIEQNNRLVWFGWIMVFITTFRNISVISWWSILLMEEIGVPGENPYLP
jgi:hypothetical protein